MNRQQLTNAGREHRRYNYSLIYTDGRRFSFNEDANKAINTAKLLAECEQQEMTVREFDTLLRCQTRRWVFGPNNLDGTVYQGLE